MTQVISALINGTFKKIDARLLEAAGIGPREITDNPPIVTAIYPEMTSPNELRARIPDFPETCPACGSKRRSMDRCRAETAHATYECGGRYDPKPQIQSHTNKWWGMCYVVKAKLDMIDAGWMPAK